MKNKALGALLRKEFYDVIRDKKTIIMMLLMPLLLYPLIFIIAFFVASMIMTSSERIDYTVALDLGKDDAIISSIEEYNKDHSKESRDGATSHIDISWEKYDDVSTAIRSEDIDLYLTKEDRGEKQVYIMSYSSSISRSSDAADVFSDLIDDINDKAVIKNIEDAGLDPDAFLSPVLAETENIASNEEKVGNLLGSIIPFFLVISLLTGITYPAVDLTVGEKERGTMETTFSMPVRNRDIIVSKFIVVAGVGIVSALINILSIILMGAVMLSYIRSLSGDVGNMLGSSLGSLRIIDFLPAALIILLILFAFSFLLSAVSMCIASFAKSNKEANNYITPLTLVVMLTGYIGFIPNIELTGPVAMIPVANVVLIVKELLLFNYDPEIILIVLLSNIFYAVLAVLLLGKLYDSEGVLYEEGMSNIRLFEKRSNIKKGLLPSVSEAWFVTAVVIVLFIFAGGLLQIKDGLTGLALSHILIIFGIPVMYSVYTKKDIRRTFSLRRAGAASLIGGELLIIGTLLIGSVLTDIIGRIFPEDMESVNASLDPLLGTGFVPALIVIALLPAITEETLFRGFIFSAFREKMKPAFAIILTSVLFGIFHMSIVRFFTTALLGAVICYATYKSRSIFTGAVIE